MTKKQKKKKYYQRLFFEIILRTSPPQPPPQNKKQTSIFHYKGCWRYIRLIQLFQEVSESFYHAISLQGQISLKRIIVIFRMGLLSPHFSYLISKSLTQFSPGRFISILQTIYNRLSVANLSLLYSYFHGKC